MMLPLWTAHWVVAFRLRTLTDYFGTFLCGTFLGSALEKRNLALLSFRMAAFALPAFLERPVQARMSSPKRQKEDGSEEDDDIDEGLTRRERRSWRRGRQRWE